MTSLLRHPWVVRAAAVAVGVVFVYASLDKIAHPREFARIVYHYRLIGPSASLGFVPANLVAVILPWLEAACGVLLIAGAWRREAATLTAGMLVVFLVAVGSALLRGIDVANCGCFSVTGAGRAAGLQLLLADLALLAATALAASPGRPATAPSGPALDPSVDQTGAGR